MTSAPVPLPTTITQAELALVQHLAGTPLREPLALALRKLIAMREPLALALRKLIAIAQETGRVRETRR